jgi:hypothetical protein
MTSSRQATLTEVLYSMRTNPNRSVVKFDTIVGTASGISRYEALQEAYLNSFRNQSVVRQTIGYGFYFTGQTKPNLCLMDDYGSCFKVVVIPYQLKFCKDWI